MDHGRRRERERESERERQSQRERERERAREKKRERRETGAVLISTRIFWARSVCPGETAVQWRRFSDKDASSGGLLIFQDILKASVVVPDRGMHYLPKDVRIRIIRICRGAPIQSPCAWKP